MENLAGFAIGHVSISHQAGLFPRPDSCPPLSGGALAAAIPRTMTSGAHEP
jgi:hypothetical protein